MGIDSPVGILFLNVYKIVELHIYTILGSATDMVSHGRQEIFNAIRDVLLEESKEKLTYSKLYEQVVKKLAASRKTDNKISYRDYSSILDYMVKENKLNKEDSGKRGGKVYYSLTKSAKKEYQHDILGIDEDKERLRKLYQLLFFYEVDKYGKLRIVKEEDFNHLLELVDLSKEDLRPSREVEIPDPEGPAHITEFQSIKGIEISKYEYRRPENVTIYYVTLPGFSIQEILYYHERNTKNPPLVYSNYYLRIFGYVEFKVGYLKNAFRSLKNAGLIKRISIMLGDLNPDVSSELIRYTIADDRLRKLISEIWKIYGEIHTILYMKSSIRELDNKDRAWLSYLFGDENAEKILQDYESKREPLLKYGSENDKEIEISKVRATIYVSISEIKERIQQLNKKYSRVVEEYNFPLNLINEILLQL